MTLNWMPPVHLIRNEKSPFLVTITFNFIHYLSVFCLKNEKPTTQMTTETRKAERNRIMKSLLLSIAWTFSVFTLGASIDLIRRLIFWLRDKSDEFYSIITLDNMFAYSLCVVSAIYVDILFFKHNISRGIIIFLSLILSFIIGFGVYAKIGSFDEHRFLVFSYAVFIGSFIISFLIKSRLNVIKTD